MNAFPRRIFLLRAAAGAAAVVCALDRAAQAAGPKVEDSDPVAVSLGYRDDSRKVDAKKFPKHEAAQVCSNCQLFQGAAEDPLGGCALFAGKQVASGGWCSAWNKKAS